MFWLVLQGYTSRVAEGCLGLVVGARIVPGQSHQDGIAVHLVNEPRWLGQIRKETHALHWFKPIVYHVDIVFYPQR